MLHVFRPEYRTLRSSLAGDVKKAYAQFGTSFPRARPRGRKAEGLRFEKKVVNALEVSSPDFISALPFRYLHETRGWVTCIPDGIWLTRRGEVTVVEVKLRHTIDAWFQLRKLYGPVVQAAFPWARVRLLEVTRFYHPEVRMPEEFTLCASLAEWQGSRAELGVVIWGR